MVGIANLKAHTDSLKKCQMNVNKKYCYFQLSGLTTFDFLDILNYKSWVYKTYQRNVTVRYVNLIKKLEKGNAIVRTSVGFGPLLMRYLRSKGFQIREQDIEAYRSRLVVYPDLKIKLYDFQERMVQDWMNVGGVGVVKSPTGSGKCPKKDTLILTDRGLIKIEDIVRKKEQTTIDDHFIDTDNDRIDKVDRVISLKSSVSGYRPYNITDKYDIGEEDLKVIRTSIGFKISGTKEHPIVVIDRRGKLIFKKLEDITKEDYVAITYNTQKFNNELELSYHYRFNKYSNNFWRLDNIKYMNKDIARLLGYIIAEANAKMGNDKASSFTITNYDKEIQDDIKNICKNLGIDISYTYIKGKNDGDPISVIINSVMFTDFMYYLGYKHLAQNKEVPWSILQSNKECQIEFIKTLFDGDGTVYEGDDKHIVELGSSSYELCRQIQLMLLNMGIIARLDRKKGATLRYREELRTYDDSYRLTMYGADLLKFADTISFGLTRKREILDRCVERLRNRNRWSSIVYPHLHSMFKMLHERLKEIGKHGIYKDKVIFSSSYDFLLRNSFHKEIWSYINGERLPGRSTLEKLLYLYSPIKDVNDKNNSLLREYGMTERTDRYSQTYDYIQSLYDNFIFDKVEDISEEKDRVYDITVEDVHSYIGNGMINHNTIVGCRAIKQIGRKSLILVHTSDLLMNVWNDSLIKTFGPGVMSQVGIIGGGLTDDDRMAMKIGARNSDFEENARKDIVIATFQTLNNRLDELSQYKFGLMIVDECIPIDSEIWTKDGIIKYEDLGYGTEYKNDIFQVWSRNNEDNVVNNGYKKIKTRMKNMYRTIVETGDELVCSLDHKVLTRRDDGREEFVEIEKVKNIARSLIKPYDMRKECILARVFGYVLGDGDTYFDHDRAHFRGSVSGNYEGLSRMSYDIKKIGYPAGKIIELESDSIINTIKYGEKFVHTHSWGMSLNIYLAKKLVGLGCPMGKKTDISFKIPDWIMNGDIEIKREFLGGYFGAEGSNPDFRGNENNKLRRSFFVNRFSISKRSDLVENGVFFANQIRKLLSEFNVEISDIKIIDSNIRKDGSISRQVLSTISNNKDNLLRFLDIGFRYCYDKEREGEIIRLYFKYISMCDEERKEMDRLVIELFAKGNISRKAIADKINRDRLFNYRNIEDAWENSESILETIKKKYLVHLTEGMVSDILYPHKSKKDGKDIVANQYRKVLPYDLWLKKVSGDFIFLDILRHKYRGCEQGYTLTVNKDHNYFVGGFVYANCHHVPASMFRKVNAAIRAPYKMGLSATTKRLDGLEKDVFSSLGDIQSSVTIRELINKGILAEPRFQSPVIVDKAAIDAIENCGHAGLVYSRFVKKTSASSKKKMDYIINICKNVAARNRKFLLFTDYVRAEDVYVRDMYAESLLGEGIRVSIIDQGMSTDERSAVFGFLETGEISGIVFGKLGSEGVNIPSVDVVIMANAIKCISGDILVPTDRGIIRAEDLDNIKPNIVSTMDLEDRSIVEANINELYNFGEEDTIRIMTNNGYEIEGSLSHMVVVKDKKDNLLYKSLCDICVGDEVIICGSNIYGKDIDLNYVTGPDIVHPLDKYVFSIIDRINNSDVTYKIGGFKYKYVKIYYEELKKIFSPDKIISYQSLQERVRYRFGKRGVSVSRPRYDKNNDKWFYTFDNSYQGVFLIHEELRKDVIIPSHVTKDLAELLGYIVSEGYIDSYYNTVEIVNLNDYMVERLIYLLKSLFDYDARHSILKDRNNIRRIRCHSKTILEFLNYLDIEHRSGGKVVPWCILRSSKDIQLTFLRALFGGDGGITDRNNIVYGSVSKRLCDEVHIMLLNMGIISKKDYNGVSWSVLISSTEADKFMKDIGFSDNREFEYDINRHDHKRLSISHYKDRNVVFFDSIVSKVKSKNKLYDMNVDKYHSFIGGGFMNHNSPITFTQRVGRVMRKVPGKDFCDVYEILLDINKEYEWSDFNFAEYKMEGFQKLVYKVD